MGECTVIDHHQLVERICWELNASEHVCTERPTVACIYLSTYNILPEDVYGRPIDEQAKAIQYIARRR